MVVLTAMAEPETPRTEAATAIASPMAATVAGLPVAVGAVVEAGAPVVVLEVMKMEHPVTAPARSRVVSVAVAEGDAVVAGQALLVLGPVGVEDPAAGGQAAEAAVAGERADLAELRRRRSLLADDARPEAVAKRHARGQRTARENVADLCDDGSFQEYGGFAFAAQEARRSRDDLQARTPADGLITGIGTVNAAQVGAEAARCAVAAYDYTVLAGTQGQRNHHKKDRLFELAERLRLPVVLFAEGGGGRPGDTDVPVIAGLDTRAFEHFARLSGLVPLVGVVAGRCFAGNAALLGCCDVVIATADANIGMGGPAMIEGGGLGVFRPEEVGPIDVQVANGVVDVAVADEAEAVAVAKQYLSYFQGPVAAGPVPDPEALRDVVPEHRKTVYDVRRVIDGLADEGSVLELRRGYGTGIVTALVRLAGKAVGVIANDPAVLGGAIDAPAADKAARFLQLCDGHDLPVLSLCDTPGFLVGPEAEETAQVRRFSRLFVSGASLSVPLVTVVLRKAYGLGAMAMAGGSFKAPVTVVSWPTGEFGGMGLEGAVRLGFRAELEAIADPVERQAAFDHMVEAAYRHGQALNLAAHLEIDDVIDPAETRDRVLAAFAAAPPPAPRTGKKRPGIDPW
ncbi:carboxyl transferase domain-containing protein [Aquihabitans sp. G128]|uniref:carboxyl transferase domain-containing protein n=1 Tax=Aquihabitans sp. G128 TaxID=2849779 RepID=UPI0020B204E3|nr:carboxyl transferase domain-containing protein [Aquihabitans sp. G128]